MLNAMIVDDEPLIRAGILHSIQWEQYGMRIVADVGSMPEAQKIIAEAPDLDLLFTDISMPQQSGIELIRWVSLYYPRIAVVVLSYHSEFSYIQESLRYGVIDYIVKSEIHSPDFGKTMENIAQKVQQKLHLSGISGGHRAPEHYASAVALISSSQKAFPLLPQDTELCAAYHPVGQSSWLLLSAVPLEEDRVLELESHYPDDIYILTFEKINVSVSNLLLAVNIFISRDYYYQHLPNLRIYAADPSEILKPVPKITGPELIQLEGELASMQWIWDNVKLDTTLEKIAAARIPATTVYNLFYSVQSQWKRFFPRNDIPSMFPINGINFWYQWLDWFRNFRTFTSTEIWRSSYSAEIISSIQSLLVWIGESFMEDISLSTAADRTNLSPSYLSRCFKDITGKTFSHHLRDTRINYAKKLLTQTKLPICRISELCGYDNQFYFDTVFKKATGKTPGAYRQAK